MSMLMPILPDLHEEEPLPTLLQLAARAFVLAMKGRKQDRAKLEENLPEHIQQLLHETGASEWPDRTELNDQMGSAESFGVSFTSRDGWTVISKMRRRYPRRGNRSSYDTATVFPRGSLQTHHIRNRYYSAGLGVVKRMFQPALFYICPRCEKLQRAHVGTVNHHRRCFLYTVTEGF